MTTADIAVEIHRTARGAGRRVVVFDLAAIAGVACPVTVGGVGEAVAGRLGAGERVDGAGAVTRARRRAGAGNLAGDSSVAEIALTHSSFRSRSGVGVGPSVDRAAAVARAHHAAAVRGAERIGRVAGTASCRAAARRGHEPDQWLSTGSLPL